MKRRLVFLVLLAACDFNAVGPGAPFVVPPVFSQWFSELEACSGLSGDLSRVRFSTRDDLGFSNGNPILGYWRHDNQIVLRTELTMNESLVKHEMMHFLLRGGKNHPAYYFAGVCGALLG